METPRLVAQRDLNPMLQRRNSLGKKLSTPRYVYASDVRETFSKARAEIFGTEVNDESSSSAQALSGRPGKAQYKGKDYSHIDPDYRRDIEPIMVPIYPLEEVVDSKSSLEDSFPDLKQAYGNGK